MEGKFSRLLQYLPLQIIFWIGADVFLIVITKNIGDIIILNLDYAFQLNFKYQLLMATIYGAIQGVVFGCTDQLVENTLPKEYSLGRSMVLRVFFYAFTSALVLTIARYLVYSHKYLLPLEEGTWLGIFKLVLIYNLVMAVLITFINQVRRKFGPNNLLPIILGKYQKPREEFRVFLFMDLTSSTTIAESIGHLRYSAFIRHCFLDINAIVPKYKAEIYQYAGDEIILTWSVKKIKEVSICIDFFFACKNALANRKQFYISEYGSFPEFKAGAHIGKVTAVEIGDIKRDIAYHGDVLNTTSRIEGICSGNELLISQQLKNSIANSRYIFESLGQMQLKGKQQEIEVFSVEEAHLFKEKNQVTWY